ncbi:MAG: hypothetical protein IH606_12820 [Burkholderiales bacterium]|nr:hypothetical protein [Burkholderiales bacterium]
MQTQAQKQPSEVASAVRAAFPDRSPRYSTVAQFSERNPAFTTSALRNYIFKAHPRESTRGTIPGNGLLESGAIRRIGRKVLIHEGRFFEWVETQGTAGPLDAPVEYGAPRSIHVNARRTTPKRNAQALGRAAAEAKRSSKTPAAARGAKR